MCKVDLFVPQGMIGIVDPPRPETAEVVRICRGGGIRVLMVWFLLLRANISAGYWRL